MECAAEMEYDPELSSVKGKADGGIYLSGPIHPCLKTFLAFLASLAPMPNILWSAKAVRRHHQCLPRLLSGNAGCQGGQTKHWRCLLQWSLQHARH